MPLGLSQERLHFTNSSRLKGVNPSRHHSGFTLMEIVIVVFLLAVIATIAIPHLDSAIDESRYMECEGQLESIRRAKSLYTVDHLGETINLETNLALRGVFESYFVHPPDFPPHCPRVGTNTLYTDPYHLYKVATCPFCAANKPPGVRAYKGQP